MFTIRLEVGYARTHWCYYFQTENYLQPWHWFHFPWKWAYFSRGTNQNVCVCALAYIQGHIEEIYGNCLTKQTNKQTDSNNGFSSDDHFVTILLLSYFSASIRILAFRYCTIWLFAKLEGNNTATRKATTTREVKWNKNRMTHFNFSPLCLSYIHTHTHVPFHWLNIQEHSLTVCHIPGIMFGAINRWTELRMHQSF